MDIKAHIIAEMKFQGKSWDDVLACTLTEEELKDWWETPFTVWTTNRVYFIVQYDGWYSFWCSSVSRVIDMKPTPAMGDGPNYDTRTC